MSAGEFLITTYETNNNQRHPIVVQPETVQLVIGTATNVASTDPRTSEITAYARKPTRRLGLGARNLRLSWTDPMNPPAGYRPYGSLLVPALTEAFYDGIAVGDTGTYLGTGVTVTSKLPEVVT